ncbi:type II toxin-antitoxin system RelE/ParE family toxin [Candidatus Poribacteria bacterium]|nr:type II toxin-antitoxin system RelE/ParE family toxin [Candidatus Poribacteria bacterium]MBT5535076.1 type II toxin-antitoxin system RelE/ParE family toxin [Candidatus Poribacteria bacterium]MBT5712399.1 type II toxin-antitoxin system RelE/ParE family toxin [Candidatus Poribacteria bacterium]MBT7095777.1 type II toxin-antitoxin system RelE/ParE family toxin [Candidatus Poribacteria bacterium]MBT7807456.1 type II toxin-antitoxin system RelE/ParE family toxin [Candidatus Poribacteria bacterium
MVEHRESRTLRIYTEESGRQPFIDWIKSLGDRRTRARIRARLDRVEVGAFGDCKSVGDGVRELRLFFGPGYRIYFGEDGADIVLLLCGGEKDGQRRDLDVAKRYWDDYKRRRQ